MENTKDLKNHWSLKDEIRFIKKLDNKKLYQYEKSLYLRKRFPLYSRECIQGIINEEWKLRGGRKNDK